MMWVCTFFHGFKTVNLFHGARYVTDIRFLLQNQSFEYGYIYLYIYIYIARLSWYEMFGTKTEYY